MKQDPARADRSIRPIEPAAGQETSLHGLVQDLKSRIRSVLPKPAVALIRRVIDVIGGIVTEVKWTLIRRDIAKAGVKGEGVVLVHIHYPETWSDIAARIRSCLLGVPVVVTASGDVDVHTMQSAMPEAHLYKVPNRGRDVLPFLQVVRALDLSGVGWLLKIHGKKSSHHRFGDEWMKTSLNALLPSKVVVQECVDRLTGGTPVIGPRGFFYGLDTHWEPNRARLESITGPLDPTVLGFFGGTMWWIRPDTLEDLPRWRSWHFPRERGQTDGTTGHVFERLVCVQPQLAGKTLASVDPTGVHLVTSVDPFPYEKI